MCERLCWKRLEEYFMIPWKVLRPCLLCVGAQEVFLYLRNIENNEASLDKTPVIESFLTWKNPTCMTQTAAHFSTPHPVLRSLAEIVNEVGSQSRLQWWGFLAPNSSSPEHVHQSVATTNDRSAELDLERQHTDKSLQKPFAIPLVIHSHWKLLFGTFQEAWCDLWSSFWSELLSV